MRKRREAHGRLYVLFHEVNDEHFAGLLPPVAIELRAVIGSKNGNKFIGETLIGEDQHVRCIVLDERFVLREPWNAVEKALKHEIVHVWQVATGQKDTHGESFQRMARRLGISPTWTVD